MGPHRKPKYSSVALAVAVEGLPGTSTDKTDKIMEKRRTCFVCVSLKTTEGEMRLWDQTEVETVRREGLCECVCVYVWC